ncbi:MAG: DUF2851 family protein [Elusimicrobia bacterium]|nr:DUF2851 family protein [Elusimicrobiota bacterium]
MKYIDEVKYHNPQDFSNKYKKLYESLSIREPEKLYNKDKQPVTEKLVKMIWFDQKIERRGLKTIAGKNIVIVSPGEWNFDEGPDFKNAKINIDGQEITGDIEVDIYSLYWKKHNHYKNKNFNNVILHVFLWQSSKLSKTLTQNKGAVPSLELIDYVNDDLEIINSDFDVENYPYSSKVRAGKCAAFSFRKYSLLEHIIGIAGDERIKLKSEELKRRMSSESINQIVYKGIIGGLGYGQNRENFRKLAEILPLERIEKVIKLEKFEEKPIRIQALFYGVCGLIPEIDKMEKLDDEAEKYVLKIKKIWKVLRQQILPGEIIKKESWKFRGIRPYNFPYRRLAAASLVISKHINNGFDKIFQDFYDKIISGNLKLKEFLKEIKIDTADSFNFWFFRTTFNSKKFLKPVALIGEERNLLILINVFLPLAIAKIQTLKDGKIIYQWWLKQPIIATNRTARLTSWKIGFGDITGRGERFQQGLLQIFKDFCDIKKGICTNCSFQSIFNMSMSELLPQ